MAFRKVSLYRESVGLHDGTVVFLMFQSLATNLLNLLSIGRKTFKKNYVIV